MTTVITSQPELQEAVYARLTGDATLMGLITGVFDEVPTDAAAPYIVLADFTELASEAHDRQGVDASFVLNIWSRYRGYLEVATINKQVSRLLHRPTDPPFEVPGFQHVSIFNETHQFMRDPDPDLRRLMARYRVWLETQPD